VEEVPASADGPIKILGAPEDADYLLFLVDLEKLSNEEIDDVDCLHYRGKVDVEALVEKEKAVIGKDILQQKASKHLP
jgi:hypothetical protein